MMALDMTVELAPMLYGILALLLVSGVALATAVKPGTARTRRAEKRTRVLRALPAPAAA